MSEPVITCVVLVHSFHIFYVSPHMFMFIAGFYMYIEGSSVTHGDPARLLSAVCSDNGPLCLHFWYNMFGSATAMALNIYQLKDNKATKLWSAKDNHGPEWHPAYVDISVSGPFQVSLTLYSILTIYVPNDAP